MKIKTITTATGINLVDFGDCTEVHNTDSKFCPFELPSTGSGGGGGGSITVDSELSETSENPLQNKATTAAINEIKSKLSNPTINGDLIF